MAPRFAPLVPVLVSVGVASCDLQVPLSLAAPVRPTGLFFKRPDNAQCDFLDFDDQVRC